MGTIFLFLSNVSWIEKPAVRSLFERVAIETEEDYQKLISILQKFNVDIVRPDIELATDLAKTAIKNNKEIMSPWFMQPRDYTIMLQDQYFTRNDEILAPITNKVKLAGNQVHTTCGDEDIDSVNYLNSAMITRIGKDVYIGNLPSDDISSNRLAKLHSILSNKFPDMRFHQVKYQRSRHKEAS